MLTEQQQQTRDDYQQLYDKLQKAHDALPGNAIGPRLDLNDQIRVVREILSLFALEDIQANTVALEALAQDVASVNQGLQQLKEHLEKIAGFIKVAAEIVQASNNALHAAEAFLKVV